MFNFLEPESSGLGSNSTDPVMAAIDGMELVRGLRSANNIEFSAESADLERMMPTVENDPGVYSPTTTGEIDILTGGSNDDSLARGASATNPNAEDVYRFWDEQTESHLFTADEGEFEQLRANSGRYRYEGVEFEAPLASVGGSLPVYRFENQTTGTFFYTLQTPEAITDDFPVLESDGIAFYAFSPQAVPPSGAVPIYRFFNEGASSQTNTPVHFYTGTDENRDNVRDNFPSFTYEGPGWYAYGVEGSDVDPEPSEPGNTLSAAFNIGDLTNRTRSFNEFVGSTDSADFYQFDLSQTSDVSVLVSGLTDNINVRLILDENNNAQIDSAEVLFSDRGSEGNDGAIDSPLGAGTYFIEVSSRFENSNTRYNIEFASTPTPSSAPRDPGNSLNTALNLGDVTGRSGSLNEFVGSADSADFYRFEISETSDLSLLVSGLTDNVNVRLILDENNNARIDSAEVLFSDRGSEGNDGAIDSPLGAGTYFIEVSSRFENSNTNYTFSLSAE
ncbi:MAG: pre-peptidase C-terminal domain-containing protein [Cyanobacteriota bacterium]|nr:pre-peptidase C-terminal domain-containing protein [Cyanobacteriota bacterium]